MASSSGPLNEELLCSICLDVFTDPVTTPCGHNVCRICLNKCWTNTQTCFCPLCKENFSRKPDLKINTKLREVVQHFKEKLNLEKSELLCDFCDERKQKAVKSCLTCQSSYCETHLEPHHRVPRLKETAQLINGCGKSGGLYMPETPETSGAVLAEMNQTCIQLFQTQTDVQQMIQSRMKKIQEIQHSVELRKRNTEEEKSSSAEIFTDLIRSIERCQSELLKLMEEQQKAAEKQAEDLIKELQQEITDLKKRNTELEQISHTDDHLHILQMHSSLNRRPGTKNWTEIRIDSDVNVFPLHRALTQLKKTQEALNKKLSQTAVVSLFIFIIFLLSSSVSEHIFSGVCSICCSPALQSEPRDSVEIQLFQTQTDVQQMIQNRMKKIEEIQHSVELRKRNTEKEKSSSVDLFTALIRSIERCQSELLKMMEEQQKAAEKQAEDLIKELQQEITDLKKRNTELEQISHTDDHLHLLQV
ncbi:hypothetical protein cypCar_00033718 [Cyprinus carpio]|nr:hypothetical protein cypCar_00033718 [Cyprinus carpio]